MREFEWQGQPLVRSQEFTLEVPIAKGSEAFWRSPVHESGERTVRVQLAAGQTWMSAGDRLKRGQAVDFVMQGLGRTYRFVGRVKSRRLGRLVLIGRVVE